MKIKQKILSLIAIIALVTTFATSAVVYTAAADAPSMAELDNKISGAAQYVSNNLDCSMLSETSTFNNVSKQLILIMNSNINYSDAASTYFNSVSSLLSDDGTLNVKLSDYAYPNDGVADYAYLLIAMAINGNTTGCLNGIDICSKFNSILNNLTVSDLCFGDNSGINPYHLSILYSAVKAYSDNMTDSAANLAKISAAINTVCDDKGLNYYGYSADNNGMLITFSYSLTETDPVYAAKVSNAVAYTESEFYDAATGISHTKYEFGGTIYDDASPDSTALALALFAQSGKSDLAANSYKGLTTYESPSGSGAFTYYGRDNLMATTDALIGMLTYKAVLFKGALPFDVSELLNTTTPGEEETTPAPTQPVTEPATEPSVQPTTNPATENTTTQSTSVANEENSSDSTTSVPTGDVSNLTIILIILAASGVTVIIGLFVEKKKNKRK